MPGLRLEVRCCRTGLDRSAGRRISSVDPCIIGRRRSAFQVLFPSFRNFSVTPPRPSSMPMLNDIAKAPASALASSARQSLPGYNEEIRDSDRRGRHCATASAGTARAATARAAAAGGAARADCCHRRGRARPVAARAQGARAAGGAGAGQPRTGAARAHHRPAMERTQRATGPRIAAPVRARTEQRAWPRRRITGRKPQPAGPARRGAGDYSGPFDPSDAPCRGPDRHRPGL